MESRVERRLTGQRKQRKKRIGFFIISFMALALTAAASYLWFSGNFNKVSRVGSLLSPHKVNILVLGVDERSDDVGRSDTMFVVTIDTSTKEVSMLSVPRDTRVKIPGHGWDKINHAYAEGGVKLSQKAVEDLLGIPIDYYMTINFAGFYKIVDALGGVDIDVDERMYYEDPYDNLVINIQPGVQHMDGKKAIQYVRYRDSAGDIGRIARQQKFIKAMMREAADPTNILKLPAVIKEINEVVKTNMSTAEMLNLAKMINDAQKQGLKTDMVPGKPAYIDEVSYWLPDIVALRQHVAKIQGITPDEKYASTARNMSTEYQNSIPREMKVTELSPKAQIAIKALLPPTAPEKPNQATKPKDPSKSNLPPKPTSPSVPAGKVKVEVLNASGSPEAGEKIAGILRNQGFEVTGVSNITTSYKNTVVISNTADNAVVNKLTGLPFRYALQVSKDEGKTTQATVIVGKDYQ